VGVVCPVRSRRLIVGGVIAWLLAKERTRKELDADLDAALSRAGTAEGKAAALEAALTELRRHIEQQSARAEEELKSLRAGLAGSARGG